jgi:hypothetical protein
MIELAEVHIMWPHSQRTHIASSMFTSCDLWHFGHSTVPSVGIAVVVTVRPSLSSSQKPDWNLDVPRRTFRPLHITVGRLHPPPRTLVTRDVEPAAVIAAEQRSIGWRAAMPGYV